MRVLIKGFFIGAILAVLVGVILANAHPGSSESEDTEKSQEFLLHSRRYQNEDFSHNIVRKASKATTKFLKDWKADNPRMNIANDPVPVQPSSDSNSSASKTLINSANNPRPTKTIIIREQQAAAKKVYTDLVTLILAIEIIGSATNASQLQTLCVSVPVNSTSTFAAMGGLLNTRMLRDTLCARPLDLYIPANPTEIKKLLQRYLDQLWIQQSYAAMAGNYTALCNIFSAEQAGIVGMDGVYVKNMLCKTARQFAGNSSASSSSSEIRPGVSPLRSRDARSGGDQPATTSRAGCQNKKDPPPPPTLLPKRNCTREKPGANAPPETSSPPTFLTLTNGN
ncbi:hypothetical protein AJ80_02286 [Polytolypa hystricis UAMH7299]|uniref:Uncharacterized protein n=1 Tax=Polytolypa hystricis (strain UAMH7299) TaxID=1447883 RepID=A0A2B7YR76_POLH7|nr:hypothetical protein AJ80_02286 [Polytolypa hystricis UAMH7299]